MKKYFNICLFFDSYIRKPIILLYEFMKMIAPMIMAIIMALIIIVFSTLIAIQFACSLYYGLLR